ncbi:hypothetical protein [Acidipropionibacterium jensenii]|uniref:hypothetical protein n=1 Tax=Acidipropionibacterium jensenii TaxID=1749 RepID=UPI002649826F|nr:hypothetical protein [Acidipropionibacterium jensenii]
MGSSQTVSVHDGLIEMDGWEAAVWAAGVPDPPPSARATTQISSTRTTTTAATRAARRRQ